MKNLLVTSFFPPEHSAGTENYTFTVASGLAKVGNEVHVLCAGRWTEGSRHWNGYTDQSSGGVAVRRLHMNWAKAPDPNRYLYDNPVTAKHITTYLNEVKPDLAHITSCLTLSASAIGAIKQAKIPVIVTLTDFWFLCPRVTLLRSDGEVCSGQTTATECLRCMLGESAIYRVTSRILPQSIVDPLLASASRYRHITRWRGMRGMALNMMQRKAYLREILAMADCVITPSKSLRNVFLQNGFNRQIRFVPHGHDLSWLESYARQKQTPEFHFGYLGQIVANKGVHLVLQAFKTISSHILATFSVFGDLTKDPSYAEQLQRLASDCPRIQFKGAFVHEHLGKVLEQIDVVVVPSVWYENNPLVIQEAFAGKIPVIATDLGGMREFVQHEVNGLLFERNNVQDLSCQLQRIINEPGLLERLRAGIPPVKSVEAEIRELGDIYREFIEKPRE